MNAPAEYVVCRHLASHPYESVSQLVDHVKLHYSVVRAAKQRLGQQHLVEPSDLVQHALRLARQPQHEERSFYLPNPDNWFRSFHRPYLESGERVAADVDGLNLIPEHFLVYVAPEDANAAYRSAIENFGKLASARQANLLIRVADPWLESDGDKPIVELGQRLIDYEKNPNIRLARRIAQRG